MSPGDADCQQKAQHLQLLNREWYLQIPSFRLGKGQSVLQRSAALTSTAVFVVYVLQEASPAQAIQHFQGYVALPPTGAAAINCKCIHPTTRLFSFSPPVI